MPTAASWVWWMIDPQGYSPSIEKSVFILQLPETLKPNGWMGNLRVVRLKSNIPNMFSFLVNLHEANWRLIR